MTLSYKWKYEDKRFLQLLILYDEYYEYEPKFCVWFRIDKIEAAKQAAFIVSVFFLVIVQKYMLYFIVWIWIR